MLYVSALPGDETRPIHRVIDYFGAAAAAAPIARWRKAVVRAETAPRAVSIT